MSVAELVWNCTDEEYHADRTHLTSTMVRTFMESIPKYHGTYVTGELSKEEETDAIVLGSAVHCMVLYGWDKFKDTYAVSPECDRRTTAGKATYAAFLADSEGKIPLLSWQYAKCCKIADAIKAHPVADRMMHQWEGQNELAVRWEDPIYGIQCKCKFDRLINAGSVVDLKTSRRPYPQSYPYEVRDKRYHVQAAFYLMGRDQLIGESTEPYYHVVVDNEPPHEVVVYQFPTQAIEDGTKLIRVAMSELSDCIDTGKWESRYPDIEELYWRDNGRY